MDIGSAPASPPSPSLSRERTSNASGSIAEDVIGRRMRFSRFAANWLSRRRLGLSGFMSAEKNNPGIPLGDMNTIAESGGGGEIAADVPDASAGDDAERPSSPSDQTLGLMPKLLRYAKLLFASQNFFFAYDYDLSRQVTAQPLWNHYPLYKMVDPLVCLLLNRAWR